jgi:AAA15 family ATPase/GTPase
MIRVKSVQINRFRGIREGVVRDFADVNLLVGRNNSGKSTVVEAIHRMAGAVTGNAADPIGRRVEVWTGARGENNQMAPEIWYMLDQTERITISAEVGKADLDKSESIILTIAVQGNDYTCSAPFNFQGKAGVGRDEVCQFLDRATVFRPEDARNSNIERTLWQKIIGPRHDKALTLALNTIFNQNADTYSLLPDGKVWLLFPKYSVPLDSQGDGNRAALRCLTLLTVLRRTLLIAEEVECHQHPGSLTGFAKALCKQAKDQEVQLFLPTQSAECVRAFLAASGEAGAQSAVFHLKLDNGVLEATRLAPEAAQTLLDTGVDVRFLDLYG